MGLHKLPLPLIESARTVGRPAVLEDAGAIVSFYKNKENEEHLRKWSPAAPPEFFTVPYWQEKIKGALAEYHADQSLRLLIFTKDERELVAMANFTSFERGPFQNCRLGYKVAAAHQGKGLMHESLMAAIGHIFTVCRLHRIEANYMPENVRSEALLLRLGFTKSGFSPSYLRINGEWRDHINTFLLNETW